MNFLGVPQPGPAQLCPSSGPDEWLEAAKQCKYLPEAVMMKLCSMVKDLLMEESNVQPVRTPVTICGDIHGQFFDLLELFRVAGGFPNDSAPEGPKGPTRTVRGDDSESYAGPSEAGSKRKGKRKIREGPPIASMGELDDDFDEDDIHTEIQSLESRSTINDTVAYSTNNDCIEKGLNQNFVFLGDFVDRGYFSLETFSLLMCLKVKFPDKITLVRGNHESRQITQIYGFYDECQSRYGSASVWKACCQVFDFIALGALIDGKVLGVHGGLSPEVRTLDQIRVISRAQEIPHEGAFCDLVWSDPEENVDSWAVSPRGAGWLFGGKVAEEFNHVNNLDVIARAHQLVNEGYKYNFANRDVVTVWSAPNYCYRCGNVASIMTVKEDHQPSFTIFSAVPDNQRAMPATRAARSEYFL